MKAIRFSVLALAALVAAACLPVQTKAPIGQSVGYHPDPALLGVWKGHGEDSGNEDSGNKEGDKDGIIVFLKDGEDGMTAILCGPDGGGEWEAFAVHAAKLGGRTYMSVREQVKDGKPVDDEDAKHEIALAYRIANGRLVMTLLDEKATAAAIHAGKIKGEVESGGTGDVRITADAAAQDAFFATQEGAALFGAKLLTMRKLD
ncbi:MAG: hypothetical protein JOZ72_16240 [Alphaproteobacteria bacterium]|nr:hypothetical protein [Alphaproteobacteria bacterium]